MLLILLQVYGVLDVQRVAGNFHISVHGLNIYVAQMVNFFFFSLILYTQIGYVWNSYEK